MSDEYDYPKGKGALFVNNDRKAASHPHFRGRIELTREQVMALMKAGKQGKPMELQAAGWKKVSNTGVKYIFIGTEVYVEQQQDDGWGNDAPAQDDGWGDEPQQRAAGKPPEDEFTDDDIPF